jgi:hypothetical protein
MMSKALYKSPINSSASRDFFFGAVHKAGGRRFGMAGCGAREAEMSLVAHMKARDIGVEREPRSSLGK